MYEHYRDKIAASTAIADLELTPGGYILVSVHMRESVGPPERLEKVLDCPVAVSEEWKMPVVFSTHPRTRARLETLSRKDLEGITFHDPFGYFSYQNLQLDAKCVISESVTISEESANADFNEVSLREIIERPGALKSGSMIITGVKPETLLQAIEIKTTLRTTTVFPEGYGTFKFSNRVLKLSMSTVGKKGWKALRSHALALAFALDKPTCETLSVRFPAG
jgi:UDP-N-acetylglucosamine 2-epimerase (non-hydrolysing)